MQPHQPRERRLSQALTLNRGRRAIVPQEGGIIQISGLVQTRVTVAGGGVSSAWRGRESRWFAQLPVRGRVNSLQVAVQKRHPPGAHQTLTPYLPSATRPDFGKLLLACPVCSCWSEFLALSPR